MCRVLLAIAAVMSLTGCAVVAVPIHATADLVSIVPVVGNAIAVPFRAAGNLID
jgi:hypothetical protein